MTPATWFGLKNVALGGSVAWLHEIYVGLLVSMPAFVVISKFQRRLNSTSGT